MERMKNDAAYREESKGQIAAIFEQCNPVDGRIGAEGMVSWVRLTNERLASKGLFPDERPERAEQMHTLCNSLNPETDGSTLQEIMSCIMPKIQKFN